MPVNPVPNGPSPSVLAYNGDSPRGWNDPPTFAFSHQSAGSKPKLDLRKRVSHHQALQGTTTPQSPSSTFSCNEVSDRMASMSLHSVPVTTGSASLLPPSTTPPLQSKVMHNPYVAPPSLPSGPVYSSPPTTQLYHDHCRSHSMPSIYMPTISPVPSVPGVEPVTTPNINTISQEIKNPSPVLTTQAPGNLGQPLFALRDHSFEPVKTHNHSGVRSTAEIGDHLDDHCQSNQQPKIFHPIPHPTVSNGIHQDNPPLGNITPPMTIAPPLNISPVPVTNIAPLHGNIGHGISTNQPPTGIGHYIPPSTTQPNQAPVGHVTSTSALGIPGIPVGLRTPTPPSHAPFIDTGSLSTGNTPRCLSPEEDESSNNMSDDEGLKATIEALNDVKQKFNLEKRVCDDIAKRLDVMSKMWMEGKLGKTVKSRMIKLAKALDEGDGEEAHCIHVSIIVDHVAEVNQWMVAVKRLISLVRQQKATNS